MPSGVSSQSVQDTKRQIHALLSEIRQMSRGDADPAAFYQGMLSRTVTALAAVAGAVWTVESGQLELQFQVNLRKTGLSDNDAAQARHAGLLQQVLATGEPLALPPDAGASVAEDAGNPTEYLALLVPVHVDDQAQCIVEIFQRPDAGPATQKGYVRFLGNVAELTSHYLSMRHLRRLGDRQSLWHQLEAFTRTVHQSLDPRRTAYLIANEGARLVGCDRVSVAQINRGSCSVVAISGQDDFNRRANSVVLLEALAAAVAASGEPLWYAGDTTNLAPQIETALHDYVDETHSRMVCVLPVTTAQAETSAVEETRVDEDNEILGAVVFEQFRDARVTEDLEHRATVVCEHSAIALQNAFRYDGLFLMPLWRALGKTRGVARGRSLPKVAAALGALALLFIALFLIPADFQLAAQGTLQPTQRPNIYAGVDGVVTEVLVHHGQQVEAGQVLARMRNRKLEEQVVEITGRITETLERLNANRHLLLADTRLPAEEQIRLSGQQQQLNKSIESLRQQLQLLGKKQEMLEITSPISGEITTWDIEQRLIHRPVERGHLLMTIADAKAPWELVVNMPEKDMGYVQAAATEQDGSPLDVEFILATDPGVVRHGSVLEIESSAELRGEDGNTVLIKVDPNEGELPASSHRRPGAGVTAKISCGRRSLGYVWFHDLFYFVQSKVLF